MNDDIRAAILAHAAAGTLLDALFNEYGRNWYEDTDPFLVSLADLHNSGEIELLDIVTPQSIEPYKETTFFEGQNLYRALIPHIEASAAQLVTVVQTLIEGAGQDLLTMMGDWKAAARNYAEGLIHRVTFAHRTHGRYPTLYGDYRVLIQHPREQTEDYRKAQTKASTLYPLLCVWIAVLESKDTAEFLEKFAEKHLEHCTSQFWLPGEDSESKIYLGDNYHGIALSGIPITADAREARATIGRCV